MLSTGAKVLIGAAVLGVGYAVTRKPKPKKKKVNGKEKIPVVMVPVPARPTDPGAYTNYWTPEIELRAREGIAYWMGEAKVEPDLEVMCPTMYISDPGVWVWEEGALYVVQLLWEDRVSRDDWPPVQGVSPDWMVNVWGKVSNMARKMMCPNWKPIT